MSENFIKPQELRIGNLVIDIETGKEYIIKPIDIYNASISKEPLFIGVGLTEEKLVKARFRKLSLAGYDCHFTYKHPKLYTEMTALYNADFSMKLDNVARKISFVHRLQNLYLDLTGEELPIS